MPLFTKNWGLLGPVTGTFCAGAVFPLLTLLIATTAPLGKRAMFCCPLNPGPEIKNPKTSLNCEPTYSGYSSEPNTYLNSMESEQV